jgi:hypothetical protein
MVTLVLSGKPGGRRKGTAMERRFYTTPEFAEVARVPADTARWWRYIGKGPQSFKLGRRVLYRVEDVEAWLAEQQSTSRDGGAA